MTGMTNVDELLSILNTSESILRYNSQIEEDISQNGGTVLYSYNNIIIASDINDALFAELQKNSYIEYIKDLPLKRYGEIDYTLLNQLDISKIDISGITTETMDDKTIETITDIDINTKKSNIDGVSGKSKKSLSKNKTNDSINNSSSEVPPTITNTGLTLSVMTNEWFTYPILVDGTLPFKYEFSSNNFNGELTLNNNILSGKTNNSGIYNIIIKVTNKCGYDQKTLTLTVQDAVKIINSNLNVNNKIGTYFSYPIETSGDSPKTFDVLNLPAELTRTNNVISGIFSSVGTYNMTLIVSGTTTSDSKQLTVNVGNVPIIDSPSEIYCQQYSGLTYTITPSGVTYNIIGILPEGLKFSVDTISGTPIYTGITNLKMKATNPYGTTLKDLKITIYKMGE
jgi:hypothetical protein